MNREYIKDFIEYKNNITGCSSNTLETYEKNINNLHSFINKDLEKATQSDVIRWLSNLKENKLSNRSRNLMLTSVKQIFLYLKNIRKIDIDEDILNIEKSKVAKKEKKVFTKEEFMELVEAATNIQYKAIILFVGRTGVRFCELSQMTMEHYYQMEKNLSNGIVLLGKGNKERKVYPSEDCFKSIKKYVETRRKEILKRNKVETDVLWLSRNGYPLDQYNFNRTLKHTAKKIGYPFWENVSVHILRHTAATIWLKDGNDIKTISEALGHTSIATTNTYVHSSQSDIKEMMCQDLEEDKLKQENDILKNKILEMEIIIAELNKKNKEIEMEIE